MERGAGRSSVSIRVISRCKDQEMKVHGASSRNWKVFSRALGPQEGQLGG